MLALRRAVRGCSSCVRAARRRSRCRRTVDLLRRPRPAAPSRSSIATISSGATTTPRAPCIPIAIRPAGRPQQRALSLAASAAREPRLSDAARSGRARALLARAARRRRSGDDNNRVPPELAALVFEMQEQLEELRDARGSARHAGRGRDRPAAARASGSHDARGRARGALRRVGRRRRATAPSRSPSSSAGSRRSRTCARCSATSRRRQLGGRRWRRDRRHRPRDHEQPGRRARRRRAPRCCRSRDRRARCCRRRWRSCPTARCVVGEAARALAAERPVRHHPLGEALHGPRPRARDATRTAGATASPTDDRAGLRFVVGDRERTRRPRCRRYVLRELKRRAEAALGEPVSKAVITVPAYFNDSQRQATQGRRPARRARGAAARERADGRVARVRPRQARRGHDRGLRSRRRHLRRLDPEARAAASSRCWRPAATRGSAATTSTPRSPSWLLAELPEALRQHPQVRAQVARLRGAGEARAVGRDGDDDRAGAARRHVDPPRRSRATSSRR